MDGRSRFYVLLRHVRSHSYIRNASRIMPQRIERTKCDGCVLLNSVVHNLLGFFIFILSYFFYKIHAFLNNCVHERERNHRYIVTCAKDFLVLSKCHILFQLHLFLSSVSLVINTLYTFNSLSSLLYIQGKRAYYMFIAKL